MRLVLRRAAGCACLGMFVLWAAPAQGQNWSFDAREVALGGVGSTSNVAFDMVSEEKPYRAIVLPFGLFQVIPNWSTMDPTSDDFDLARTIEYSASPIHYIVGRDTSDSGGAFLNDLRNGELSRDLNAYGGFRPQTSIAAEGLASPSWGKTFKFREIGSALQGVYIGAGPYFSMQTEATLDEALADLLASPTPVYTPTRATTCRTTPSARWPSP